jgi:flagellar biogenesis protein FliO
MLAQNPLQRIRSYCPCRRREAALRVSAALVFAWAVAGGIAAPAGADEPTTAEAPRRTSARPLALAPRSTQGDRSGGPRSLSQPSRDGLPRTGPWWTAGSLCLVLAVILITARLVRHRLPFVAASLPTEVVEPLGRCQLDPKQSVYLVRCGSQLLVLGSSGGGLRPLTTISDPAEVDRLAGLCRHTQLRSKGEAFSSIFSRHARGDRLYGSAAIVETPPLRRTVDNDDELEPLREADHVGR